MYANVLKFHVLIPHEKISQSSPILELFPFDKITLKSYICTVVTIMAKQCWSQTVLESGSWGHSVLQTPALDIFIPTLFMLNVSSRTSVSLSICLSLYLLNHTVEFNQTCYMTSLR